MWMRRALLLSYMTMWTGCRFLSGYADGPSSQLLAHQAEPQPGFYRLLFDDFQGLSTDTLQRSALPYKVVGAALMLHLHTAEPSRAAFHQLLQERYGFVIPETVANVPHPKQPSFQYPLGLVGGTVQRALPTLELEVVNTGCSTCHSASLRDAQGEPTKKVWVGLPSSDIHLERYVQELYASLTEGLAQEELLMNTLQRAFPEVGAAELSTIRRFVLPPARARFQELARLGRFTPYSNGGVGLTNGAGTLQYYLGWLGIDAVHPEQAGYTSVPSFGGLGHKRMLLCDGVYEAPARLREAQDAPVGSPLHRQALASMASMVTLGTLGVAPEVAVQNQPRMQEVVAYVVDSHRTPPFPGTLDEGKADAGAQVYEAQCQRCHGRYEPDPSGTLPWRLVRYPEKRVPLDEIASDPVRTALVTEDMAKRINDTPLGKILSAQATDGYMAIPLNGLWATAPYLHNGSVPTLWHLLHPEARPAQFEVGGHALDYDKLGIKGALEPETGVYRYPKDFRPLTQPEVFDTRTLGRSNRGHEQLFEGLEETQKASLLEHLKRL